MAGLPDAAADDQGRQAQPVRCHCHRLVCIRYGNVIEIKCSKCKRMISIHTRGIERVEIR